MKGKTMKDKPFYCETRGVVYGGKTTVGNLRVGAEFNAGIATLKVLEHQNEGALVITKKIIGVMPYNTDYESGSDWSKSSLRKYLNNNFLDQLQAAGKINAKNIVHSRWNVGLYGTGGPLSCDKIGLLSLYECDNYKKYLKGGGSFWTSTPRIGFHNKVWNINDYDEPLTEDCNFLLGVRPAFRLKPNTVIDILEQCPACGKEIQPKETVFIVDDDIIHATDKCLRKYVGPEKMTVEKAFKERYYGRFVLYKY